MSFSATYSNDLAERVFDISSGDDLNALALDIFHFQSVKNAVYHHFLTAIGISAVQVTQVADIPFLPIEFFKTQKVYIGNTDPSALFTSSGTTGSTHSKHYIADLRLYESSFTKCFERSYGPISEHCLLALLPAYLKRDGSSLIYMIDHLIKRSGHAMSGFYLDDLDGLAHVLNQLGQEQQPTILIGVSYALLDLIKHHQFNLQTTVIMETGGMKGRSREMLRTELHALLCEGFGVDMIHSEYGMTELLSQAYSIGDGIFECPPWMKVTIRDPEDPFEMVDTGMIGGINVIDLANIHSCSFMATQDLGKVHSNGSFEVLGRFDHSDVRGCNLLVG